MMRRGAFLLLLLVLVLLYFCHSTKAVSEEIVAHKLVPYTESPEGCACWWDLTGDLTNATGQPYSCACCKDDGVQCGYPMHNYCQKRRTLKRTMGCPGLGWRTLSQIGHPCHFDPQSKNCAWCRPGDMQCGPYADFANAKSIGPGQFCRKWNLVMGCYGISQDCRNFPWLCDPNATCKNTNLKLIKTWNFHTCVCNKGYVGNGITCAEELTGEVSSRRDLPVALNMVLTTDFVTSPEPFPDTSYGPSTNQFMDEMANMLNSNQTCPGCNTTVIFCEGNEAEKTKRSMEPNFYWADPGKLSL